MPDPKLAVRPDEAARMLSLGRTFFRKSVLPELVTVDVGSVRIIPVAELLRWLDRRAATNSAGEQTGGGRSGSGTRAKGTSYPRASELAEIRERLRRGVARCSRERSEATSTVVELDTHRASRSRRRHSNG